MKEVGNRGVVMSLWEQVEELEEGKEIWNNDRRRRNGAGRDNVG